MGRNQSGALRVEKGTLMFHKNDCIADKQLRNCAAWSLLWNIKLVFGVFSSKSDLSAREIMLSKMNRSKRGEKQVWG